jgi:gamma-glutamyltranspeptidase/glutathione hydrolase
MLQVLDLLEAYPLNHLDSARRRHLLIEAMRLGYRERTRLGDTDHVDINLKHILSPDYIAERRREIRHRATPSADVPAPAVEAVNTTHFSILDREGNRVAATLSINGPFGAGFVPPDTGVLLNNEMDDFVAQPGVPNLYGLVGSAANAIAPGKRPLSSMTPTFLETDERVAILGTPGGSRIISMVLLATLDFAQGRGGVDDWVARPRLHHQYLPDVVEYEPGALTSAELRRLRRLGHRFKVVETGYGNMQAVLWDKAADRVTAATDPRGEGAARVR